ncbi:hypothetical protein PR048_027814 [Dryococelus australis]|uniref:Reverse transcriptase/retrotransposon-derived protein RNase H-like domain-containing protein n=1 Tax=Dryococelus australis TaxID=614101 RepID=A0ABQ9GHH5_9NEOP|nr:hypothetical protein PR048_027814 [Dryococelus australis]
MDQVVQMYPVLCNGKIGKIPDVKGAQSVFLRERNAPYALMKKVDAELDTLEAIGVLTKAETSDCGSPLVVIPKTYGRVCLYVDYKVNAHYPIREIDNILISLLNSHFFCRIDLFKAYLHVPVDEQSRIIDKMLHDVPKTMSYFDDIIVHGSTREENPHCSKKIIEYLGHIIEFNKISKSPGKVATIVDIPRLKSTEDLRKFRGMVTDCSRFIHGASTISSPLHRLLCMSTIFKWTSACEAAFRKSKQAIASDQVLVPYDPDLPVQLDGDASPTGIAEVLSHIVHGHEHPIAFASRSLTALDREALAIAFTVNNFFQYLFGRHFKLVTDKQPLTRIFNHRVALPKRTAGCLQRYAAFMSGFNYTIDFTKGIENSTVDCLS